MDCCRDGSASRSAVALFAGLYYERLGSGREHKLWIQRYRETSGRLGCEGILSSIRSAMSWLWGGFGWREHGFSRSSSFILIEAGTVAHNQGRLLLNSVI